MPRYRDDEDYEDSRGVHRRRFERKRSNTPIIVGAVIIGVALVGILLAMVVMGEKDDPETQKAKARMAAERLLLAARTGDRDAIFDNINAEGAQGWVIKRLGVKLAKRYRYWSKEPDREEAMRWRQEQDTRIVSEIKKMMQDMRLDDTATIERVVQDARVRFKMSSCSVVLRNRNGQCTLSLMAMKAGEWIVQNWQTDRAASGR